ncbi:hypothetical protein [Spartinivicinus ruber]|uniref:hypothetical protein n=1 Tax=Spartinivicinus ruber TaxID=2683272 RepID=UPI0013D6E584|nr:hypothetical protein [Spartinivicinus ruber]
MTRNDEEYIKMSAMTLLTPKSVKYEGVPGGMPTLTPEDVAAALGMGDLPREAYLLGLVKYNNDKTVIHELDKLTQQFIITKGINEKWREPWPTDKKKSLFFFLQFARQMINEVIFENTCQTCNGTGVYQHKSFTRKCRCSNGKRALTKAELAEKCCITYKSWCQTWHARYLECLDELHSWDKKVNHQLFCYLFEKSC